MAIAAQQIGLLQTGAVVSLEGALGAGKTTFVRGLLRGLGWRGPVRSPTYNLVQVYETDPPVVHADLYRLESAADLGLEEYVTTHALLVEWAERDPWLQSQSGTRILIEVHEGDSRVIEIGPYSGAQSK